MLVKLRLLLLTVVCLSAVSVSVAQPLACPVTISNILTTGAPTTVCPGKCTWLTAHSTNNAPTTTSYTVDSFSYQPYPYNSGTVYVAPFDDNYGGVVHLPFPFCFYGHTYSAIVIGTNGEICFDTTQANAYCPWPISGPLPGSNSTATKNCIMGAYYDMYYVNSGTIYYATYGTAPCRVFVVSNFQVPMFSCTSNLGTQQIVLHESTNQIDVNIASKPQCTSWNSGFAVVGIEDATGANFVTAPGKNATDWVGNNLTYSFLPTGNNSGGGVLYQWYDPLGALIGTGDSLRVCPFGTTNYHVKATVYTGCDSFILTGTQQVAVSPFPVVKFTDTINYGCAQDTVYFLDQTTGGDTYKWAFNDNSFIDTNYNPVHIFTTEGNYNVKLIATSSFGCIDSVSHPVDTRHPLKAAFSVDKDSICQFNTVNFTNSSTYTIQKGKPTYFWDFGDGTTDTSASPSHKYTKSGVYRVKMRIKNFVPCLDSTSIIINVDTVTYISFTLSDSVLCQGNAVAFNGTYSHLGNTGINWNFGDGTIIYNRSSLEHAYETAGNYTVTFTAKYRKCPDTSLAKNVTVYNFPLLNLGPDTALCPGTGTILISDLINNSNPIAKWIWNTGDTSSNITIDQPGVYYTTVSVHGCTTADSVWVKNDCYVNIPNVFTPNSDGVNDYFFPRQWLSNGVTSFEMSIFNRWGQEIYATKNINGRGWDGKLNNTDQPAGVYIYLITVSFQDGRTEKHQGNVTLMR